jgi:hypothetical protein
MLRHRLDLRDEVVWTVGRAFYLRLFRLDSLNSLTGSLILNEADVPTRCDLPSSRYLTKSSETDGKEISMEQQTVDETTSSMSDKAQDLASAAAGKVSDATAVVSESAESLVELVRRYPVPSVLIGMGIGYLLVPQLGNSGRRGYFDARTGGSTLSNMGSTMKHTAQDLAQNVAETAGGMKDRVQNLASTAANKVSDATAVVGESADSLVDMARRNPVPSLLIGLGMGYLRASSTR